MNWLASCTDEMIGFVYRCVDWLLIQACWLAFLYRYVDLASSPSHHTLCQLTAAASTCNICVTNRIQATMFSISYSSSDLPHCLSLWRRRHLLLPLHTIGRHYHQQCRSSWRPLEAAVRARRTGPVVVVVVVAVHRSDDGPGYVMKYKRAQTMAWQ